MQLAQFILNNMETLLAEWETFAATLTPAAKDMSPLALRDYAESILEAAAKDIATPQTAEEQVQKSKGRAPTAGEPRRRQRRPGQCCAARARLRYQSTRRRIPRPARQRSPSLATNQPAR